MKKILLSVFAISSIVTLSQTSIQLTNTSLSSTISPNSIIDLTTVGGANTNIVIDIKNTASSTKSYKVIRYDIIRHGVSVNDSATAYFCFAGSCYGAGTRISPDVLTLAMNQSASQVSGSFNMITADLNEASTVGVSFIKYTVYNTVVAGDSIQFALRYNSSTVGLNEIQNSISSLEVYPNPATDFTSFKINSSRNADAKLEVYNFLGSIVSTKNISLIEGKNKVDYNVENLSSGIYFASIKMGTSTTTKKFIVK